MILTPGKLPNHMKGHDMRDTHNTFLQQHMKCLNS